MRTNLAPRVSHAEGQCSLWIDSYRVTTLTLLRVNVRVPLGRIADHPVVRTERDVQQLVHAVVIAPGEGMRAVRVVAARGEAGADDVVHLVERHAGLDALEVLLGVELLAADLLAVAGVEDALVAVRDVRILPEGFPGRGRAFAH